MSLQLESLRHFVDQRRPAPAPRPEGGAVVVGGGKGGVGTSTMAALLAVAAAGSGAEVLLVDSDASLGSLALLLGVPVERGWGAMRGGEAVPQELLVPVTESLSLLPGGGVGGMPGAMPAAERQALFRRISSLYTQFDLVVVDGGSRLESVLAACGGTARRVLAISTPDRISMAATYALAKVLNQRFPGVPVELLVNRGDADAAVWTADEIRGAAHRFLRRDIECIGSVPEDASLRAGMDAGMGVQDAAAGSPTASALQQIAQHILREHQQRSRA